MASSRRTYDTDNITLRTVFAKNPDNTNVPALRALTADGAGGAYWAIPSSLGGIPAYNRIVTTAATYTADLSFNTFRLLAGQNIGMVDGPIGSNQTTLYGKSFSQFDVSGNNTLVAFTNNLLTPTVRFAGQGGIQITSDPATNTLLFNGSASIANVSTGIYGFNEIKVTPVSSTITSSVQGFGGDFITATSPSTLLRLLGYNDIQLSTNVTTNSIFFTISTFTSEGYLAMSNVAYGAYPSSISTVDSLLTSSFISSTQYFQSVNQVNLSSVYSSIDGLAMSTGAQYFLLTGLINARATIIQLNDEIADVNSNIQSTSVGLGSIGYLSSPADMPNTLTLSNLNVSSIAETSSNLKVNVAALWSTLFDLYPACFN
jgi:hypothetical protein